MFTRVRQIYKVPFPKLFSTHFAPPKLSVPRFSYGFNLDLTNGLIQTLKVSIIKFGQFFGLAKMEKNMDKIDCAVSKFGARSKILEDAQPLWPKYLELRFPNGHLFQLTAPNV